MTFQFASPWFLLLLFFIPFLAMVPYLPLSWAVGRQAPAGLRYADVNLTRASTRSWRLAARPILPLLRGLVLILFVMALARPQLNESRQIVRGDGVDISLALDISGSMGTLDFQPNNRLEAAKQVIDEFIQARPYDRIGLIVFASQAFAQSPLTVDHTVLSRLLQDVDLAPDLGIEDGTAIGLGLANAANLIKDSKVESRVVILLTDGVNNTGEINPMTAAEAARELGIRVYTVGVGRPGQGAALQQGLFGPEIVNQENILDEETLRAIAAATNGQYYRAADTDDLRQIYDEINSLEKSEVEIQIFSRHEELVVWFLGPAILLFLLEFVLRQTLFRKIP